jgi:hypothetical protein
LFEMALRVLVFTLIFACCSKVAARNQGTCDALDSIDDGSTTLTCTTNSVCNKTTCTSGSLSGFTLCLELLPCMDLPGVRFILIQAPNVVVLDQVVNQSVSGIDTGFFGSTLSVTLDQLDGAIGLEVSLTPLVGPSLTIIPYTTIPLDTESCTSPTTVTVASVTRSPTSTAVPTPRPTATPGETTTEPPTTGSDGKNTTCSVLEEIAANAEFFTCTADTTEPCDTVDCSAFDLYTAEFVLLPCRTPPAIRIVINQGETLVLDETIDHSGVIVVPQLFGLVLNITLDQFEDALGLQVIGQLNAETINVIKYTVIPLEKAKNCEGGKDGEGTKAPGDSEEPSSRSAGFQCHFFWPLLLLSLITLSS